MRDYSECVTKYSDSFVRVVIDEEYVKKIKDFAEQVAVAKDSEQHHIIDNGQAVKRFVTGLLGEAALEKLLGINIIEWSIGNSRKYDHADIAGYNVGIKTVEKGKFPIITKKNTYPQIICIKSDKFDNLVFVCGLATPEVLCRCQDDDLILSPKLRARGVKTGFYGINELVPIKSLKDLENFSKKV